MNKRKSPTLLLISSSLKAMTAKPKALLHGSVKDKLKFFAFALLFLYAFGAIAFMSGGISYLLCAYGAADSVLTMMAMVTSMMMLLTSLLRGGKALFAPRDYEFLMSLPVPTRSIALANVVSSYLYDFIYILIFFLPAAAVYAFMTAPGILFYILLIPSVFLLPMIPFAVGGCAGILVSYFASKVKNKNFITIVLNLLLVCVIFAVSSSSGALMENEEMLVSLISSLSEKVRAVYLPAELCGVGLSGDVVSWLIFAAASLLIFLVFIYFSSENYRKIHNFMTSVPSGASSKKAENKKRRLAALNAEKRTPVGKALLKREFKRYFSIPSYVVNTIIGPILIIVIAAVFAFIPMTELMEPGGEDAMDPGNFSRYMYSILPAILVFPVTMTTASAASLSIEGESRYILKSSPLKKRDIYSAKIKLNLWLLLPAVAVSWIILIIRSFTADIGLLNLCAALILPLSASVFISVFGFWCNLKHQKYDWKNELEVVKQSTPVMLVVFLGMALSLTVIMATSFLAAVGAWVLFGAEMLLSAVVLALSYLFWRLSLKNNIQ